MNFLFGFSGRATRLQWWISLLVIFGMFFVVSFGGVMAGPGFFLTFFVPALLAAFVINLSATVQRYHDRNKSGWWYFSFLIPVIGGIWQLIECGFLPGTPGDNDYGPAPGGASQGRGVASSTSAAAPAIDMSNVDAAIARMKAQAEQEAARAHPAASAQGFAMQGQAAPAMPAAPAAGMAPLPPRAPSAPAAPAFGQRQAFGQRG